jgi:uncharacterized membrane-anchored protein
MRMDVAGGQARAGRRMLSKVPEITVAFWVAKILSTAMGEATSDYLVFHIDPYVAVILAAMGFVVALAVQFAVRRYIAPVYWALVVMVAIFGTMMADVVHVVLGVPYWLSTAGFAAALAIVLACWRMTEGTLSIHSIVTRRRELFYWATVIATFALGTAAGDMTASTFDLGYLASGFLFAALFALPGLLYWRLGMSEVTAFWFAYIMTRPLGASFADWADKPAAVGGLGYGDGPVAVALTAAVLVAIAYLTVKQASKRPARLRAEFGAAP